MNKKPEKAGGIYLYKDDIATKAWKTLMDKLDIYEPVTAVCLTGSQWEMLLIGRILLEEAGIE